MWNVNLQELLLSSGTLTGLTQQFVVALATSVWFEVPCDPFSRFYLGLRPTVMVVDPEMIKQITVKEFSSFMDREVSHGNMNMGSSLCRGLWTLLSLMAFMLARHMTALPSEVSSALTSLTRLGRLHDLCLHFWSVVDPWHKEVLKYSTHLKFTVSGLSMIHEMYAPRVQCRLTRLAWVWVRAIYVHCRYCDYNILGYVLCPVSFLFLFMDLVNTIHHLCDMVCIL